jgi:DNA-binding LacI/PurR family transcriptional regulator
LIERSVDGIVLFPHFSQLSIYAKLIESKIPVVIIDSDVPGFVTDKVFTDNEHSSFKVVEKLIELGHKNIAIINYPVDNLVARERSNGYYSALNKYNIPIIKEYVSDGCVSIKCGYEAAKKLLHLKNRPTAVFPASYYMAIGAVAAILEMGLSIPEDISVISFDYFEQYDIVNVPLTCVVQPTETIGKEAAAVLLRRMKNDYTGFPEKRVEKSSMLNRKSEAAICL